MTLQTQDFLVQPVDASWLQCNIECQEACPVGTNCRGYLNLAAEGKFEEGYLLSLVQILLGQMVDYQNQTLCILAKEQVMFLEQIQGSCVSPTT